MERAMNTHGERERERERDKVTYDRRRRRKGKGEREREREKQQGQKDINNYLEAHKERKDTESKRERGNYEPHLTMQMCSSHWNKKIRLKHLRQTERIKKTFRRGQMFFAGPFSKFHLCPLEICCIFYQVIQLTI